MSPFSRGSFLDFKVCRPWGQTIALPPHVNLALHKAHYALTEHGWISGLDPVSQERSEWTERDRAEDTCERSQPTKPTLRSFTLP